MAQSRLGIDLMQLCCFCVWLKKTIVAPHTWGTHTPGPLCSLQADVLSIAVDPGYIAAANPSPWQYIAIASWQYSATTKDVAVIVLKPGSEVTTIEPVGIAASVR